MKYFKARPDRATTRSWMIEWWVSVLMSALLAGCGDGRSNEATAGSATGASAMARAFATGNDAALTASYVRLEAISEVHGNPWTSIAEFNLVDASGATMSRAGWSATADSEESVGEHAPATSAIDGDPYSFWHTQWQGSAPSLPHALTVRLSSTNQIGGFKYLPRQVGENGRIAQWRFYTSQDGNTWKLVAEGAFPDTDAEQTVMLSSAIVADQPPVLTTPTNRTDIAGTPVTLAVVASDPDGDSLTYGAVGLPSGLSINASTGLIGGNPSVSGSYQVTLQVNDGRGGAATGLFGWTITAAATAPLTAAATARYVRLQALSEVNGNPWASVAEFNVLDANGAAMARTGWTATADSQELVGEHAPASNAIDGDANSFWHTQWQGGTFPMPHALTIDMGAARDIGGFRYLPRQVGVNGRIADWRFYTSTDGSTWVLASQGTFPNSADEQTWRAATPIAVPTPTPAPVPAPTGRRATRINAFASGPLVAAPRWSSGESVTADTVRRLGDGSHVFYAAPGTTGRVEPALGSTAFDGRPIADGTAVAYLNGRTLAATASGAPVIGSAPSASAAGLTEVGFAAGDFSAPRYSASQGCKSISSGTAFIGHYCYANGPAGGSGNATAYAAGPYGAGLSAAFVYHANSWEEEFVITDSRFGLVFFNSSSPVNVEIDGVQVQAGPLISGGSPGWTLTLDYQGVVKRRTVRVVSAIGAIVPTLQGVALSLQGQVEAGTAPVDQLLVLGDSINATVVPTTEAGAQIMSYWLQRYLGLDGLINMAVGGSGYVSANPNTYNLPDLLANPANQALLASYAPSIGHVLIGAGFNDRFRPVPDVRASALASWRALRRLLPAAKITVTDGWSGSSGPDANAVALAATLTSAFAEWGDTNSRLVHSVGYINGIGNAGAPIVAGNSSYYTGTDAVHPSPAGARYLARRLADDIGTVWNGGY